METISPSTLNAILTALGEQLAVADARFHLVGSGLVAIGVVTRATRDLDVVALVADDDLTSSEPIPEALAHAANLVARDFALPPNWLNSGPTSLLQIAGLPTGFGDRMITREFGPALTMSFASRFDQIHLKLYAAADRGEPRDFADLRALKPTAEELKAAAEWTRAHNAPGPFDEALARTLKQLGVEDDGRRA